MSQDNARQAGLTDERIHDIAVKYCAFMAVGQYDITKYDCEEDFFNCVRAILAAQSADASIYQELDPSGLWEDISKERFDELKIRSDVRVRAFGQSADARNGEGVALPMELRGIAEAVASGKGFWTPCTGCYDTEDGRPTQKYAHSAAFGCEMGCGCSECGGLGVVWDDTDYEEMARFMADNEAAPAAQAPKCDGTVNTCPNECSEPCAPAPAAQANQVSLHVGGEHFVFGSPEATALVQEALYRQQSATPAGPDELIHAGVPFVGLSVMLVKALKRLSFAAQITGGVAGRDDNLVGAIAEAEVALNAAKGATPADAASEADKRDALAAAHEGDWHDMMSAYNRCPADLSHPDRMRWLAAEFRRLVSLRAIKQRERQQGAGK